MTRYLQGHLVLSFLFAICVYFASSQRPPNKNPKKIDDCIGKWDKANNKIKGRFNRENMAKICERRQRWGERIEQGPKGITADKVLTPNQYAYWRKFSACRGKNCRTTVPSVTPAVPVPVTTAPVPAERAHRKEYRALSDQERASYHAAVKQLKTTLVDGLSRYDIFVRVHATATSPGAHFGHSFLPWHREFLKEYEEALREVDPNVALPYWDSSLDQPLPNPADSVMWTESFIGTADGKVVTGPFSNWSVLVDEPGMQPWLERQVSQGEAKTFFYQDADVQFALERTKFGQFSWCVDETYEGEHGGVHVAVGGQMGGIQASPSDPIFYMHHCFVDYMWEQFRQSRQTPAQREQEYPTEACEQNDVYLANAPMRPFEGLKNIDGLSNQYTQELYFYQQRPVCTADRKACAPASPYLFCDNRSNKCVAKVRLGGNCSGFEGQDVCFNSKCTAGRCVA